ncbi:MAG: methyltransferase domain-containing protein [Planctomycetota bacterium]|nr:methyltransferase domain-containing protein [Planctomycetota bacterium]MEE2940575.1 methyltransferase domain-containing protein [Planctomycetota bacterium]
MAPPPTREDDLYRSAAAVYDLATALWSGGAIWRTRAWCLEDLRPGQRVLIPGPGSCRTAVLAAARGARVLAVERSPAMHRRARRRIERAGADVELALGDWEEATEGRAFDLVVAEHFLNVFDVTRMPWVREALIRRVAPGGRLAIADFRPVVRGPLAPLQRLHHLIPLGGCSLLTRNAMHPIHDHGTDLAGRPDLRAVLERDARSFRAGPAWFRTWIFEKIGGE